MERVLSKCHNVDSSDMRIQSWRFCRNKMEKYPSNGGSVGSSANGMRLTSTGRQLEGFESQLHTFQLPLERLTTKH